MHVYTVIPYAYLTKFQQINHPWLNMMPYEMSVATGNKSENIINALRGIGLSCSSKVVSVSWNHPTYVQLEELAQNIAKSYLFYFVAQLHYYNISAHISTLQKVSGRRFPSTLKAALPFSIISHVLSSIFFFDCPDGIWTSIVSSFPCFGFVFFSSHSKTHQLFFLVFLFWLVVIVFSYLFMPFPFADALIVHRLCIASNRWMHPSISTDNRRRSRNFLLCASLQHLFHCHSIHRPWNRLMSVRSWRWKERKEGRKNNFKMNKRDWTGLCWNYP